MSPVPRDAAALVLEAFRGALVREHIVTGAGLERALQHGRAAGLDLQDAIVSLGLIDVAALADESLEPSPSAAPRTNETERDVTISTVCRADA